VLFQPEAISRRAGSCEIVHQYNLCPISRKVHWNFTFKSRIHNAKLLYFNHRCNIDAKEAYTMNTKKLLLVLALLAGMITGLVMMAQAAGSDLAANNPNPGTPGGIENPGGGAPASGGGSDHIAPGPGVVFHNGGDGTPGSGSGSGGVAPGPKTVYGADNGGGLGTGGGAPGSGSGDPGLGGPKVVYGADNGGGLGTGGGAPGSGSGDPGLGGPKAI
jgi:hypothetical protein